MSDNQVSYRLKLKNQLCCYIKLLDAIHAELLLKQNKGRVGTSISHIANDLFCQLIEDPQISLYDSCFDPVNCVGLPVEYFGVKLLECNGCLIDQYHASVLVKQGSQTSYVTDLVNPDLELFEARSKCDVDFSEAICQLKQHFVYIREIICHNLKHKFVEHY